MGGGAIRAGRAFVELFVDDSKMQGTLQRTRQSMQKWGAAIGAIGAGLVTSFAAAAKQFADAGTELLKLSKQTGVSVEELSKIQHASRSAGVEFEDMAGAIEELNIRLGETIRDGTGPAAEALAQLGLSAEELSRLPLDKRLGMIADELNRISNPATRQFLSDEIFGGDAFKILPLLSEGADGIRRFTDEAEKMGRVMSTQDAEAAAELGRQFENLQQQLKQITVEIGGAVAPLLTDLAPQIGEVAKRVAEWARANPGLFQTLLKIGAVLAVGGPIIAGLGTMIGLLGKLRIAVMALTFTPLGAALTAIGVTIGVLTGQFDGLLDKMREFLGLNAQMPGEGEQGGQNPYSNRRALGAEQDLGALDGITRPHTGPIESEAMRRGRMQRQQDEIAAARERERAAREEASRGSTSDTQGTANFGLNMGILPGRSGADQFQLEARKDRLTNERIKQEEEAAERAKEERERAAEERKQADEERQAAMDRFRDQAMSAIESGRQQLQGQQQSGTFSADIRARHFESRQQVELELRDLSQEQRDLLTQIAQKLELV